MRSLALAAAALLFMTGPVLAETRLDALFRDLRAAPDGAAADAIETEIWEIWLDHPGRDVLLWMREGVARLYDDRAGDALAFFDRVVKAAPDYAEGWNKRANAHYLLGDYESAVADIRRTLALEPRHFAALAGLGLIYIAIDRPEGALRAFDAALAINPHLTTVRDHADTIRRQVAGVPM